MYITTFQINKPKMVRFKKIKILIILKLNFKGGQFYEKNIKILFLQKIVNFVVK